MHCAPSHTRTEAATGRAASRLAGLWRRVPPASPFRVSLPRPADGLFLLGMLVALLLPSLAWAQQYFFRTWMVEDGLPQSQVYSVLQDRRGSLWVSTNGGGVARFTGTRFEEHTTRQGLVHNQVRHALEDRQGNLWFATYRGLSKYDGRQFTNFTEAHGYPNCLYAQVFEDGAGTIWVYTLLTPGQSKLLRLEGDRLLDFAEREPLLRQFNFVSKPFLRDVYRTRQGTLLLTTTGGLVEVTGQEARLSPLQQARLCCSRARKEGEPKA